MSDYALWLDRDLREIVGDQLTAPMPRGREGLFYRSRPQYLDMPKVDGKPHLVFIAYYPYPSVIKRAIPLKKSGEFFLTFLGCCIREDAEIFQWFDQAYEVENYLELHSMLHHASPWAVHVTIAPHILGVIAADTGANIHLVIDIVDSQLYQQCDLSHPEVRLEQAIIARAQALVHKLPPAGVDKLKKIYAVTLPDYLLHSLPWSEIFADAEPELRPPYRLVYAGGVMPYRIALQRGFGHHLFTPFINAAAGQDLELTFLVNQNARNIYWEEHDNYFALERQFPHFKFSKGTPFHYLPAAISQFHFGVTYDNISMSKHNPDHFRFNMSSKIFSYLEAGLPLLVHDRFDYMRELTLEHGLGIIYNLDRLEDIPKLIAAIDYPRLKDNVRRFRDSHELSSTKTALFKALKVENAGE